MEVAVPRADDGRAGVTGTDDPATTPDPQRRPPPGAVLLGVIVAVILACVVTLIYLVATRTDESGSFVDRAGEAFAGDGSVSDELQADREAVMAKANQFALRVNSYGPDQLDDNGKLPEYADLVREVITPKFSASFDESVVINEQVVAQSGVARAGKVVATGVSAIDDDSATVLVAGTFTNSYPNPKNPDERIDARVAQFRWEVSLVKIEGEWLVDNFVSVTGEPEETPEVPGVEPTPLGEPTPSEEPTP